MELGAGTGKGTEVLAHLGVPLTCIEPDPRMAAVLASKFPQATVVVGTFEAWQRPPGGVPLLACAMAWHWLDPATRNQRAFDAVSPGGVLAVFGHRYAFVPEQFDAIYGLFPEPERPESWMQDDIVASGLWSDVRTEIIGRPLELPTEQYLALHGTFSPLLRLTPPRQQARLDQLRACLDGMGGVARMDLRTTLVLARRPAASR